MNDSAHPLAMWRRSAGLTQAEAAELFGVDRWTVNAIETGRRKPSPSLARVIAGRTGLGRHELRPDLWEAA